MAGEAIRRLGYGEVQARACSGFLGDAVSASPSPRRSLHRIGPGLRGPYGGIAPGPQLGPGALTDALLSQSRRPGELLSRVNAASYEQMTDATARQLLDESFKFEEQALKLEKKYMKKFRKILPDIKVTRYFQLENKLDPVSFAGIRRRKGHTAVSGMAFLLPD